MTHEDFVAYLSSELRYLRTKIDNVDATLNKVNNRLEKVESELHDAKPLISRYKSYASVVKDVVLLVTFLYTIYSVVKG